MRPSALWSETTLPPPTPHSPDPPSPPVGCDGVQQVLWGLGLRLAQPCPFQRAHAPDCHRSPPPPHPQAQAQRVPRSTVVMADSVWSQSRTGQEHRKNPSSRRGRSPQALDLNLNCPLNQNLQRGTLELTERIVLVGHLVHSLADHDPARPPACQA